MPRENPFFLIYSIFSKRRPTTVNLVPRLASAVTLGCARARGAGPPRIVQKHRKFPFKGIRDPEEMAME